MNIQKLLGALMVAVPLIGIMLYAISEGKFLEFLLAIAITAVFAFFIIVGIIIYFGD